MLVAASGSAFGVGFLFAFVGFVALISWIALLQHFVGETAAGTAAGSEAVPPTRYLPGARGLGRRGGLPGGRRPLLLAPPGRARDAPAPRATRPDDHRLLRAGRARLVRKHSHRLERCHARPPAGRGPARPVPEPPVAGRRARHLRRPGLEHPVPAPHSADPAELGRIRRGAPAGAAACSCARRSSWSRSAPRCIRRAASAPPVHGDLDAGDGRHGHGVRLVPRRPAPLHRGVRARRPVGPGRELSAGGAAARLQPAPALPAAAGSGAGDPGARSAGRGPEPVAGGDRRTAWRRSCGRSSATRSTSSG